MIWTQCNLFEDSTLVITRHPGILHLVNKFYMTVTTGGVLPRTSMMTVSLTGNVAHQALSFEGTGSLVHAK